MYNFFIDNYALYSNFLLKPFLATCRFILEYLAFNEICTLHSSSIVLLCYVQHFQLTLWYWVSMEQFIIMHVIKKFHTSTEWKISSPSSQMPPIQSSSECHKQSLWEPSEHFSDVIIRNAPFWIIFPGPITQNRVIFLFPCDICKRVNFSADASLYDETSMCGLCAEQCIWTLNEGTWNWDYWLKITENEC